MFILCKPCLRSPVEEGEEGIREFPFFFAMLQVKKIQLTWDLTETHIVGKDITSKKETCKIFSESLKSAVKMLIATNLRLSATQLF